MSRLSCEVTKYNQWRLLSQNANGKPEEVRY